MTLSLRDFGSYRAGGHLFEVKGHPCRTVDLTADVRIEHDPNGLHAFGSAYVQYFVPTERTPGPPIVLLHGGGLTGACWENTPDGRTGWLQRLVAAGREVHVIDNVERGRAGWLPMAYTADPITRSLQQAWTLFRLGSPGGFDTREPYPGQRFPIDALESFAASFCPRWPASSPWQAHALQAVLERLPPAILIAHSQGAETVFDAIAAGCRRPAALVMLEPSASPRAYVDVPMCVVHGDYLQCDDLWRASLARWRSLQDAWRLGGSECEWLDATVVDGAGASHMLMMDRGSEGLLAAILAWVDAALGD